MPVEHPDLVGGGHDVGQHQSPFVAHGVGKGIQRCLGEGHSNELGLGAIDKMAENPATAGDALSEAPGATETATPATRDARDQDPGADTQTADAVPDLDDGADCLMTQDTSRLDLG